MKALLARYWTLRSLRERLVLIALAVLLGSAFYVWLLQSAGLARQQLSANIKMLRSQAALVEQGAVEYERLRAMPAIRPSTTAVSQLVQAQVDVAGIPRENVRIEAPDPDRAQVTFSTASFPEWLIFLNGIQSQQVRIVTCRIESLPAAGMVRISATFARAKLP